MQQFSLQKTSGAQESVVDPGGACACVTAIPEWPASIRPGNGVAGLWAGQEMGNDSTQWEQKDNWVVYDI